MANIVRIKLPQSTYSAQLRGVTGTRTEAETVQGVYNANYDMHEFPVAVTGRYELWVDPNGGSNYSKDSEWGGVSGKIVPGDDLEVHVDGHGHGAGGKITPSDTTFAVDLEEAP